MSLNGDSCSTSSGCVSDLDTLSEDPTSPDSPISDTISDSLHSSITDITKCSPISQDLSEEFGKDLLISDVTRVVDDLVEEELIESEIVIDCSADLCVDSAPLDQILINNCYELKCEIRDEDLDGIRTPQTTEDYFRTFKPSLDFDSSLVTDFAKTETADAKSDSGHTSGHESDGTRQSDSSGNTPSVNFRPTINSVFKDVNFKCLSNGTSKSLDIISNSSKTSTTSSDNPNSDIFCCKWTNCDWPGTKDDLVDHIREIHVELQPYQQQKHNWTEAQSRRKSAYKSNPSLITADKNFADNSYSTAKKSDSSQQYVCLWEGCKVYGKASLSRNWLERHVLEQHSGPRPFKCIVEGCGQRFKQQSALERHVNSHFKLSFESCTNSCSNWSTETHCQSGSNSCCDTLCSNSGQQLSPFELHLQQTSRATITAFRRKGSSLDGTGNHHMCANGTTTPNKILKRKKSTQKVRRKTCFYVKSSEDFFSEHIMEQVRYGLFHLNHRTGLDVCGNTSTLLFHSKVIARRESRTGEVNVLLKWEPNDILPDIWVPEDRIEELKSKSVPLSSIPPDCLGHLIEQNDGFERKPKTKQRRK